MKQKKEDALVQLKMYSAAQLHTSAAVGGSLQGTKVKPVGLSTRKTEAVLFTFLAEQFSRADITPTTASHPSYVNHSPSRTDCRFQFSGSMGCLIHTAEIYSTG